MFGVPRALSEIILGLLPGMPDIEFCVCFVKSALVFSLPFDSGWSQECFADTGENALKWKLM